MTDTEKVALIKKIICDEWALSGDPPWGAIVIALEVILYFGEEESDD